jgi:hypothetical protein
MILRVSHALCGGFAAEEERIKLLEAAQKLQRDLQASNRSHRIMILTRRFGV